MPRYAISQEGIEALQKLQYDIINCTDDIIANTKYLFDYINGMEDRLGIYHKSIIELLGNVIRIVKKACEGDDGINTLPQKSIPNLINNIQTLINMGFGQDEKEPQKVLKLR